MRRRDFLIGAAGVCGTVGCGSVLHPERCGQPHSRDIDWSIVALDGLGLLLFFVPGVVAFVVDFATGAIYLPADCCHGPHFPSHTPGYPPPPDFQPAYDVLPAPSPNPQASLRYDLKRLVVPREELTPQRIEQVVASHTGSPISLCREENRVSTLPKLGAYLHQCRRHQQDRRFGFGIKSFLERWQRA